jgi:hypothetical protein
MLNIPTCGKFIVAALAAVHLVAVHLVQSLVAVVRPVVHRAAGVARLQVCLYPGGDAPSH